LLPLYCIFKIWYEKVLSFRTKDSHCNKNPFYVFPEKEMGGLCPKLHIHVSLSYLYIPRIGPHIFRSRIGKPILNIYITHWHMNVEIGTEANHTTPLTTSTLYGVKGQKWLRWSILSPLPIPHPGQRW
jgi:hypothetical protein